MWCHLCAEDYPDFEDFRMHIMEMHCDSSEFCNESSESNEESDHERYDYKSDDSTAALNASPKQCSNDDDDENKSDDCTAASNNLPKDRSVADENKCGDISIVLNKLPMQCSDDEENKTDDKTSDLNVLPRRRNKRKKSEVTPTVSKKLPQKRKISSILKKHVKPKKQKKVVFSKKMLRKHILRKSHANQEGTSEHSEGNETDHSETPVTDSNHINTQPILNNNYVNSQPVFNNNYVNSQSVPGNNYVTPQPAATNNPIFLVNPYANQGLNNYVMGNPPVQPPLYFVNPVVTNAATSKTEKGFDFSSQNILKWLTKHKELCKSMNYPLPQSLFCQIKAVHKGIFDHYCTASISEETGAVMKVYEELDCMIHKHINSINNSLSVL